MTDLISLRFQSILIRSLMLEQRCHLRFAFHRKDVQDEVDITSCKDAFCDVARQD